MATRTHVVSTNGSSHMFLADIMRSYRDQIRRYLSLLDGEEDWAYSLWRAPVGVEFFAMNKFPLNFMQSAGTSDAMSIEVRFADEDDSKDEGIQYVVGRPGTDTSGEPPIKVEYLNGKVKLHLFPNEVFDADEAADIFYQYFLTDQVPAPYVLRLLII